MTRRFTWFNATSLVLGFAFLYLPILLLVVYSFNASRLVTVWGGFSTQWYGALFRNQALMEAAWVTVRIALLSAALATVLGTLAALALTRYGRFFGRTLFTGMVYAPMVMPEVITGRSEEHTSELQSRQYLVCRLLLEKKKTETEHAHHHGAQANVTRH